MQFLDLTILLLYIAGVVAAGCWFSRRSQTTEEFTAAGGRLPGWAIGLSLFGTYLSSNTFIGNPGKAFSSNWSFFVFSLTIPIGVWVASRWFVPFYRESGQISAYTHLEQRFGRWARVYSVVCYLLTQVARSGTIMVGVAIGMHAVTGWDVRAIIVATGILVTVYTLVGGIEAVIWTDVIQSLVLSIGAVIVLLVLLLGDPGGSEILAEASAADKFSLGSFALDLTQPTFWAVLLFGIFINLTNFGVDQNYIQRYHTARSLDDARRSLWLGAIVYIPVSALFFLLGTLLWGYYHADIHVAEMAELEALREATNRPAGDNALPHFMANHLPPGIGGLMVAALFAAAMSTIDTSLNSSATITLKDIFHRHVATDPGRHEMRVLRLATLFWGFVGTSVALVLTYDSSNILDVWWNLSGIFAGGMLGLFLLGRIARHATRAAAITGVAVGVLVIAWMSFSGAEWMPEALRSPLDSLLTVVVGTLTILLVGITVSKFVNRTRHV